MITEKKEVYKHRLRAHIYFFRYCSVLKIYKSSPRPTGTAIDWITCCVEQIRHQHSGLAIRRDVAHQAHCLRFAGATEVKHIAPNWRAQRDDLLSKTAAKEFANTSEAGSARLFDMHAERDGALIQDSYQPAAGVASIEQQQVVAAQTVEVIEQHLSLVLMDAVQRCGEHQFAAWEKQPEGNLVGQCGAQDLAGAQAEPYRCGIGRDQAQAQPTSDIVVMLSARDDLIVEPRNCGVGNLGAGLREGLLRDVVHQLSLLAQVSKELIEFGLNALAHAADHPTSTV